MKNNKFLVILLVTVSLIGLAKCKSALEERQKYKAKEFVFDLYKSVPKVVGRAGTGRPLSVAELPPLEDLGVSSILFRIEPCGINLPHVHPRATELFHVLEGSFQTAFIEENNGRVLLNNLTKGQVTVFPQGLIHFEQNLGCEEAVFLSAFSHEDPGVLTLSNRLFDLPIQALTSTFNQNGDVINAIKSNLGVNPAKGRGECLKRCGIN